MRSARELLQDILDAITRIERYTAWGRETFEQDELVQVWGSPPQGTLATDCRYAKLAHSQILWSGPGGGLENGRKGPPRP